MDEDEAVRTLFPELPEPESRWEVTFTRAMGGLAPCAPGVPGVLAMYSADVAMAIAEVRAAGEAGAEAAARELCSGMAWVEGAVAEVRPVTAGDVPTGQQPGICSGFLDSRKRS